MMKNSRSFGIWLKIRKIIERKWVEPMFHYKQQYEALGSRMEALIKEKKGEGEYSNKFGIGESKE
jgi:hypothetical protein